MTQEYELWEVEDKFLLECAPHLGYFVSEEKTLFITSDTKQVDLRTMSLLPIEECVLIEDTKVGSIDVAIR